MTIEEARLAMSEAKAAYDVVKNNWQGNDALQTAFKAYRQAILQYHLTVVHDANYGMHNPISREDLEAELREVIESKLDYAPELLRAFEECQERSGVFDRWDVWTKASNRSLRIIPQKAFDNAMDVLDKHCPMRSDTGALCPPYRLKVGEKDYLVAE